MLAGYHHQLGIRYCSRKSDFIGEGEVGLTCEECVSAVSLYRAGNPEKAVWHDC